MRVEFKFREGAPPQAREAVVQRVTKAGASTVAPLFPGEQDPELASLYKAEGVPDDAVAALVSALDAHDAIEFAERTPRRKLIR